MSEKKSKQLRKSHQRFFGNTKAVAYKTLPNGMVVADDNRRLYQRAKKIHARRV